MNELGSRVQTEHITLPLSDGCIFTIYASAANPGAEELAEELHAVCESVTFTTDPDELDRADHFLLRLNEATWTRGESSVIFAKEVMDAMRLGVHCLLMHEVLGARWGDNERRKACAFEHFFMDHSTPKALIKAGLYNEIAMNVAGDEYRKVGLLKTIEQLAKGVKERQPLSEELIAMLEEEFGTSQQEPTSCTKTSQPANVAASAATWVLEKAAAAATATTVAAATATAAAGAAGAYALRVPRGSVDDSRFSRRLSSSPNSPGRKRLFSPSSSRVSGLFSPTKSGLPSGSPSTRSARSNKVLPHPVAPGSGWSDESGEDHHAGAQPKECSSAVRSAALDHRTEGGAGAAGELTSSCVARAIADDKSPRPEPSQLAEGSSPAMDKEVRPPPSGSHSNLQEVSRSKWVEASSLTSERSRRQSRRRSTWVDVEGQNATSEQPSQVSSSELPTPSQVKKHRVAPALKAVLFEERLHSLRTSRAEHPMEEMSARRDSARRQSSSSTRCGDVDPPADEPARRVSRVAPELPESSSPQSTRKSLVTAVNKHPQVLFARSVSGKHVQLESATGDVEHTALYRSQSRPYSREAHDVTSNEQRARMLKALGENASVLHEEGISATDAKRAGFAAEDLFAAGYVAQELAGAGFASMPPDGSMVCARPKHGQTATTEVTLQSEDPERAGASSTDGAEVTARVPPRRLKA